MRQQFETAADREREEAIISICAKAWNCQFLKLKMAGELDYVLHRDGDVVAIAEVKDRTAGEGYSYAYLKNAGGYLLSAGKYQALQRWAASHACAVVLIVRLTDGIYWRNWDGQLPRVPLRVAGRLDRGDWQDVEPCVFLPMDDFKLLPDSVP